MELLKKYRIWIAGAVAIIAGVIVITLGYNEFKPIPDLTEFKSRYFTFSYPRSYDVREYSSGVVSIGTEKDEILSPLVEVNRYRSDPDTARPKTFDVFMKQQAAALCGADGSVESVTCNQVGVTPYTSPQGVVGNKLDLTLVRKNLKSGTTTSETYGPIYVFDITGPNTTEKTGSTTAIVIPRYSAIFVYPSLSSFLDLGTTSPALMDQVISTFVLKK